MRKNVAYHIAENLVNYDCHIMLLFLAQQIGVIFQLKYIGKS
jgi:hypothetical protein